MKPLGLDLHMVSFGREKNEFSIFLHLFQAEAVFGEDLALLQRYKLLVRPGLIESEPGCLDRLHNRVVEKFHHDEFVESLESFDVDFVYRSLVVDLRQKSAFGLVQVFVEWIVPISGLNQSILHPTEVCAKIEQLPDVLTAT